MNYRKYITPGLRSVIVILVAILCLINLICLPGAAFYAQAETSNNEAALKRIFQATGRVLILPPFDMCAISGENATVIGPLTDKVFLTSEIAPEASDYLFPILNQSFNELDRVQVVPFKPSEATSTIGVGPVTGNRTQRLAQLQQLGRENLADVVMCIYLYVFQERIGKDYGVERPAKISFELNMVGVESGGIVWRTDVSETQQALNENLLQIGKFLKRGGRWITAREMAANAIENIAKTFEKDCLAASQDEPPVHD